MAAPPAAVTSSATVWMLPGSQSMPCSVLPVITTDAPSLASRIAIALPMPRLEPVTMATLPVRGRSVSVKGGVIIGASLRRGFRRHMVPAGPPATGPP